MNLKDEYIKIVEILLKNNPNLKLVENYKRPYCNIDGICDKPSTDENCNACKEQRYETYDVAILESWDGITFEHETDWQIHFHKEEYGICILSIEDFYLQIEKLSTYIYKKSVNHYKDNLEQFQYIEKLELYAKEFFKQVVKDLKLRFLKETYLPINFYWECKTDLYGEEDENLNGNYYSNKVNKQHGIDIWNLYDFNGSLAKPEEELYKTIRHEVLHYILDISYLKCVDDAGAFWALCEIYNAGAYEEMVEEESELYESFMYIYKNINDLMIKYPVKYEKNELLGYLLRYCGHIPWETNKDFIKTIEPIYITFLSGRKTGDLCIV